MFTTIAAGVIAFVIVILALVLILLGAKAKLVQSGDVQIGINDDPDNTLTTAAGGTLLGSLSANKIFIPSACGGKGS